MKVLFTGLSGSLGKEFAKLYPNIDSISVRYGNKQSLDDFAEKLQHADIVIHAAANVHAPTFEEAFDDNLHLTLSLLEEIKKGNKDLQIILISSMSMQNTNGEIKPVSKMMPYTLSKYLMEELSRKYDLPITIVRFSTLFYRDPNKDGLSKMISNAANSGKISVVNVRRDFIPLNTAAEYLFKLCGNKSWEGKTVNIASCKHYSLFEIAEYLKNRYNITVEFNEGGQNDDIFYNFNSSDIDHLGRIKYDLFNEIEEYYNQLAPAAVN